MIVLINGPLGVGKTAVSWALLERCDRGVMLDMDHLTAMRPFDYYDDAHLDYADDTLVTLVKHHVARGHEDFVINWVYESPERLSVLRRRLGDVVYPVRTFRLTCTPAELERRIRTRAGGAVETEVARGHELQHILDAAADRGDVGLAVDTTDRTAAAVADAIWVDIRRPVAIVSHDPAWSEQGVAECAALREVLGDTALAIHHVGSTAVEDLPAKPTLDILVTVRRLDDALANIPRLRELGYTFIDHPDNRERRFFRKGLPPTHHLHFVEADHPEAAAMPAFRDRLRADAALRARYTALKEDLLRRFPNDSIRFSNAKGAFVAAVLGDAKRSG